MWREFSILAVGILWSTSVWAQAKQSPQVRVALTRYYNAGIVDHWVTTALPTNVGSTAYTMESTLGYLYTSSSQSGMTFLQDCWSPIAQDHMVSGNCAAEGYQYLRTLGYLWTTQKPATVPIYRCYWLRNGSANHFVSLNANCEGLMIEGLLGYIPNN